MVTRLLGWIVALGALMAVGAPDVSAREDKDEPPDPRMRGQFEQTLAGRYRLLARPKTKDWMAREIRPVNPESPYSALLISGWVKTAGTPQLLLARGGGRATRSLALVLTVEDLPSDHDAEKHWANARYETPIQAGQIASVLIYWNDAVIAEIEVAPAEKPE